MEAVIARWQRAAERAAEERVRIVLIDGHYRATSSSHALGSYQLEKTSGGWTCGCIANKEYGTPCKHLWALAEALDLDILNDMHVTWTPETAESEAA
jgi:hypothetical protein